MDKHIILKTNIRYNFTNKIKKEKQEQQKLLDKTEELKQELKETEQRLIDKMNQLIYTLNIKQDK